MLQEKNDFEGLGGKHSLFFNGTTDLLASLHQPAQNYNLETTAISDFIALRCAEYFILSYRCRGSDKEAGITVMLV